MTKSEYVGMSNNERVFGQKELLNMQLDMLNTLGRLKHYKKLREEEHVLKIALKSKIGQSKDALEKLKGLLPKTEYKFGSDEMGKAIMDEDVSLSEEIEIIRKKLSKLSQE
jgi:hypothetical protein